MKTILSLFLLVSVIAMGNAQPSYKIDRSKSSVQFAVRNMKIRTVKGTFSGMQGTVVLDAQNPENSQFNVCIDAASVDTKSAKRDKHLRNEDFFDVDKYPKICFESTKVAQTNTGFIATGNLSMRGITKEVRIAFTQKDLLLKGSFSIQRPDFKVGKNGGFMVGKTVQLEIVCWLQPQ
ncbi:MAG: YceI family protein [Flavobacteriaceae bacterium]|nr:YceI family protein [Flavobacteriaceae bacterium]